MNVYLPNGLPSTYQEVEYIGTSGTQYINSGITIGSSSNSDATIEGTMKFLSNTSAQVTGKNGPLQLYFGTNASGYFYGGNKNGQTEATIKANDYKKHTFKIGNNENIFYIDGVAYSVTTYTVTGSYNGYICIGCVHSPNSGVYNYYCKSEIYGFKIRQSGTLVRNFIPCYRKSDSVIGLYDLVNNQFYTNSGTGTFSKGNDVTKKELKNAYIGYGWTPGANTICYYPLKTDVNDYSGNGRNLTNSGITFSDGVGVFNGSAVGYYQNQSIFNNLSNFTYSVWVNPSQITSGTAGSNIKTNIVMTIKGNTTNFNAYDKSLVLCNSSQVAGYNYYGGQKYAYASSISTNTWYNIVFTFDGSNIKIYKNGALAQTTACGGSYTGYTTATLTVGNNYITTSGNIQPFYGKLSEVIVENTAWDSTKIVNYFNSLKSNYGIS